jgi:hypothetical protein
LGILDVFKDIAANSDLFQFSVDTSKDMFKGYLVSVPYPLFADKGMLELLFVFVLVMVI